jgi:AAA ATPase domain
MQRAPETLAHATVVAYPALQRPAEWWETGRRVETLPDVRLRGRENERTALDQVVSDVLAGHSRSLIIRGEPGIGKTALLDDLENARRAW